MPERSRRSLKCLSCLKLLDFHLRSPEPISCNDMGIEDFGDHEDFPNGEIVIDANCPNYCCGISHFMKRMQGQRIKNLEHAKILGVSTPNPTFTGGIIRRQGEITTLNQKERRK